MKKTIALFALFVWIVSSGLISACGPRPSAADNPGSASGSTSASQPLIDPPADSSATIRIVHSWNEHKDGAVYQHQGFSFGTAVGPGVILTHNHFDLQPMNRDGETLSFITPTGQMFTLPTSELQQIPVGCTHTLSLLGAEAGKLPARYVAANTGCMYPQSETAVAGLAVDAGTQIIHLPSYITLAPPSIGDQAVIGQLAEGEWLTVDYWDEASQRLARGNFQIMQLEQGTATLSDPLRLIRPGDSGGGVYLNGQLIGNTWSIYIDPHTKRPTGAFIVALVPAEAVRLLEP